MASRGNVLFVSYYFPPDASPGSLRVGTFVRRLHEMGWRVSVVTARDPAGGRSVSDEHSFATDIKIEETRSLDLYWQVHRAATVTATRAPSDVPAPPDAPRRRPLWRRVLKRALSGVYALTRFPDKRAGWMWPLCFRAARVIRRDRVDIVFSSSPPHSSHVALALLRRFVRFRWVVDMRDPWTAPRRHGRSRQGRGLHRVLEGWVLSSCDAIVANTEGNRDALLAAFPRVEPGKVHVITNGYDDRHDASVPLPFDDLDAADVVYVGEVYAGMLDTFVGALCIIREQDPGALPVVHCYGKVDAGEAGRVAASGLESTIVFKGVVTPAQSLAVMRHARSLLLLLPQNERWTTCVPSKTYPYLFAGPPILALVPDGDAARIMRDTGAGTVVTASAPATAADAVARFVSSVRDGRERTPRDPALTAPYTFARLAERLDALLTTLTGSGGRNG